LAVGDTLSRCVGERDRSVAPLFGDAGAAVLVSRSLKATNSYFSLSADGAGADYIKVPAGGFRLPKSEQTSRIETDTHGNSRSLENLYMDGAQVFSFSIGTVPGSIDETFERFGVNKEEIDFFFLHQANDYIVSNISKRIGAPPERVPKGIVSEFGNLSSASIPVTICKTFEASRPLTPCKVLLSGFGVGLSWANCITHLDDVVIGLSVS
jgi:3-oxoacyl-[acyl-carrier-protein] synthase-3